MDSSRNFHKARPLGRLSLTNKEDAMLHIKRITLPYSLMVSLTVIVWLFAMPSMVPLSAAPPTHAPEGQKCDKSGTTTVEGKTDDGKTVKCTADYCEYGVCDTSGPKIGKCYKKTHYENVRDCEPAARSNIPQKRPPIPIPSDKLEPPFSKKPSVSPIPRPSQPPVEVK